MTIIYNLVFPTSIDWINNSTFITGYSNSNILSLFDIQN